MDFMERIATSNVGTVVMERCAINGVVLATVVVNLTLMESDVIVSDHKYSQRDLFLVIK